MFCLYKKKAFWHKIINKPDENMYFCVNLNFMIDFFDKKYRIYFHVFYWISVVLFFTLLWGTRYNNYWICFYNELVFLPVKLGVTYFALNIIIPKLLYKRKYIEFGVASALSMFFGGFFQRLLVYYSPIPFLGLSNPNTTLFDPTEILNHIINITSVMIIPVVIKLHSHQLDNEKKIFTLSQQKTKAELLFLRNQIQPHFFFNVLNDLYAMALKKSDKTPDMILKLSDLMRYVLKESTEDFVSLEKELNYIQNYIDLEKLRYGKRIKVNVNYSGDFQKYKIVPLLLLPFVENAFKHSTTNDVGGEWINIDFNLMESQFTLFVENSYDAEIETNKNVSSGIGIKNVRERLNILYPDKHLLEYKKTANSYISKLSIYLQNNE